MEFLCYHRDRPGSAQRRDELIEAHWSYMDQYAKELIARGPTLTDDREEATGSVHVVDLPDAPAARAFALDEPYYQAGVFRDVLIRRWHNLLGRTMWDFPGGRDGYDRYFVLGFGTGEPVDLEPPAELDDVIAFGSLLADDGETWLGTAALVRAPSAEAARTALAAHGYDAVEVRPWQFGGRPS